MDVSSSQSFVRMSSAVLAPLKLPKAKMDAINKEAKTIFANEIAVTSLLQKILFDSSLRDLNDLEYSNKLQELFVKKLSQLQLYDQIKIEEFRKSLEAIILKASPIKVDILREDKKRALTDELEGFYDTQSEPIPKEILDFVVDSKNHTLNCEKYVKARISGLVMETLHSVCNGNCDKNIEIFLGSLEDLKAYYAKKGYKPATKLGTDSSNDYYTYEKDSATKKNSNDPIGEKRTLVVIHKAINVSRFWNVLLQLKAAGIDLSRVTVRGTIEKARAAVFKPLVDGLKKNKPYLVLIGARMQSLNYFISRLYPEEMAKAKSRTDEKNITDELLKQHEHKPFGDKIVSASFFNLEIDGKAKGILAFRMPNGDLAYDALKLCLDNGAKVVVMMGVGGSFDKEAVIGSYQLTTSATYGKETITLPEHRILQYKSEKFKLTDPRKNVTVNSVLQETKGWYEEALSKGMSSVDVETFHIFKAIQESKDDVKIMPGLFISDILDVHPLEDKIDDEESLQHLPAFLDACFEDLKMKKGTLKGPSAEAQKLEALAVQYLKNYTQVSETIKLGFEGKTVKERILGASALAALRREFANSVFTSIVAPRINAILNKYNEKKDLMKDGVIFGFNPIFTREMASVDEDINYMIVLDAKNSGVFIEIAGFIEREVKPLMQKCGLDIEAQKFLVTNLKDYKKGLESLGSALFPLAISSVNGEQNTQLIVGSKDKYKNLFQLSDKDLAAHYAEFIISYFSPIYSFKCRKSFLQLADTQTKETLEKETAKLTDLILKRLNGTAEIGGAAGFKKKLLSNLQGLAALRLYAGKKFYQSKTSSLNARKEREALFPIKYCLNQFINLCHSVDKKSEISAFSLNQKVENIETLALLLSNTIYKMETPNTIDPALHFHKTSAELSLDHLKKMTAEEKAMVVELLSLWMPDAKLQKDMKPEALYDALWELAEILKEGTLLIEKNIFKQIVSDFSEYFKEVVSTLPKETKPSAAVSQKENVSNLQRLLHTYF